MAAIKVSPVSGDLVAKVAIALVAGLVILYLVKKATGAASGAAAAVGGALQAVNPLNNDNVIYGAANTVTGGTPDLPLGVRLYNWLHPDTAEQNQPVIPPNFGVIEPNAPW